MPDLQQHPDHLHLSLALAGTGWHPASWRHPGAGADRLTSARWWTDVVTEAERGALDLVTFEDAFGLPGASRAADGGPDERTDRVAGHLDAQLLASRLSLVTRAVGLVPTVTTTHTEPFHVSTALASLDHVTSGRAGWRVQVSARRWESALFGRRELPEADDALAAELFGEARAVVDTVRALWDSWEDDAVVRDAATGRFLDRHRVHAVHARTPWFSVRGPSITPRPPQGQPVVVVLAHTRSAFELAAATADVVFTTPADVDDARRVVAEVRAAERAVGREGAPLQVHADLLVALDDDAVAARNRLDRLDALDGAPLASDALVVADSPAGLADRLLAWRDAGVQGFRLRPAVTTADVPAVVDGLVPLLRSAGAFRSAYSGSTLREHLGLARPANRFTARRADPLGTVPAGGRP